MNFVDFEKTTDKDVRRLTTSHLKRLFQEREPVDRVAEALGLPPSTELNEAVALAKVADSSSSQTATEALIAATPDMVAGASAALANVGHDPSVKPMEIASALHSPSVSKPGFLPQSLQEEREIEESDTASSSPRLPLKPQTSSPTAFRSQRPFIGTADEQSSCTENESQPSQFHSLVKRFDTPKRGGAHDSESDSLGLARIGAIGSARRPGMRRGKTEEKVSTKNNLGVGPSGKSKATLKSGRLNTDSALSDDEATKRAKSGSRSSSPSRGGHKSSDPKSRIPTRAPSSASLRSASKVREPNAVTSRRAAGPPSSYRPPKNLELAPRPSARTPVGRSISSAASSTPSKDRAKARSSSRDAPGKGGLSRQSSSINLKAAQTPSRLPAPTRAGSGTKSRVNTIARHFDKISRDAARETETHRQMMANRSRRARPVAITNARVEVFSSVKEAVKDESESSDEEDEAGNASHADEEDEGESDADSKHTSKSPESQQRSRMESCQPVASSPDANAGGGGGVAICDKEIAPLEGPKASCVDSEMESDVHSGLGPSLSQISATLPSYLRGSFSSDAEAGSTERKSLLNTLSGLFRGGDSLPMLEYPL